MKSTSAVAVSIQGVLAMLSVMESSPYFFGMLSGNQVLGVEAEASAAPVREPQLQREADRAEGNLLPRHLRFFVKRDLEAFFAWLEIQRGEPRGVEKMHLVHARHGNQAERREQLDLGAGFFERFPNRALCSRLVVLHEAGGQRPIAVARLDGAAAQKHLALVFGHRADDEARILIVDVAALVAHPARQRV